MLILKFLQTLIKALNSKGGPGEIAAGMAIGLAFGLTPLMSLHNIFVLAVAMLTTVSFPGVMLGWAIAVPLGFALDPLFHRIGMALLTNDALAPLFIWIVNTPIVSLLEAAGAVTHPSTDGTIVFDLAIPADPKEDSALVRFLGVAAREVSAFLRKLSPS